MSISYPPIFINEYLKEKVLEHFQSNPLDGVSEVNIPFFPTSPTDIDSLTETFPDSQGMFAVYDRMFKMRRRAFPHIKCEQLLYYFYKMQGSSVGILVIAQKLHDLLDRGDESAQELNSWLQAKQKSNNPLADSNGTPFKPIFFHDIKVYQLEETRDIVDFGTARTYAGNKLIIDYDYHVQDYS